MVLAVGDLIMVDEDLKTPIEETSREEVPPPPMDEEDYNLPFTD